MAKEYLTGRHSLIRRNFQELSISWLRCVEYSTFCARNLEHAPPIHFRDPVKIEMIVNNYATHYSLLSLTEAFEVLLGDQFMLPIVEYKMFIVIWIDKLDDLSLEFPNQVAA